MIQRISDRMRREDKGFTLIELMVVVLIIAILIAIAIPTFLGARRRAQDRAAQSSLRNTVTAAKAIFTDDESYSLANAAALASGEPSIEFNDAGISSEATLVSVGLHAANVFQAAAFSKAGKCWYVQDVSGPAGVSASDNPGTRWSVDETATETDCDADNAPVQTDTHWKRNPSEQGAVL